MGSRAVVALALVAVAFVVGCSPAPSPSSRPGSASPALDPALADAWLAFSRSVEHDSSDIFVARVDGSEERRLTTGPAIKSNPAWSPDGRTIAYRVEPPDAGEPLLPEVDHYGIFVVPPSGGEPTSLTKVSGVVGGAPSWSPDSRRLVMMGRTAGERTGIHVMDANGTDARRLTPGDFEAQYPAWSPDGTRIAYTTVRGGDFTIWSMAADGTDRRQITQGPEDNWPMWSTDGRSIAFGRESEAGSQIVIVDIDGANAREVTVVSKHDGGVPATWAPSEFLAFACLNDAGEIRTCAARPDGTGFSFLFGGRDSGFPSWKPKG